MIMASQHLYAQVCNQEKYVPETMRRLAQECLLLHYG